MNEKLKEIVRLLESSQFTERSEGTDLLLTLRNPAEIMALHEFIEINDNYGLRLAFHKLLFKLLRKDNEKICGLALSILFQHATSDRKALAKDSENLIDEFLSSSNMFQYLKFLALKACWKNLGPNERYLATKKIGNFQLVEVLSLLIDNFRTNEERLLLISMEVFKRLGDKRANRFMRNILADGSSEALIIKALEVMSELGNYFDRKYFRKYLKSMSEAVKLAALEGLARNNLDGSLKIITDFYHEAKSEHSKLAVVEILSAHPSEKSILTLLKLWQEEELTQIEHKIEWALNEIESSQKLNAILSFYPQADEGMELKIIALLNEMQHSRCYDFFLDIIQKNKNEFLTMAAMEAVAHYDDPRTIPYLQPYLKDSTQMLHYYALASMVKHSMVDLTHVLEDTVAAKLSEDRHHHQLILNVLHEQPTIKSLNLYLQSYVLTMLTSSRRDNRYLAYSIVGRFCQEFELKGIFELFSRETNDMVSREGFKIFGRMFSKNPFYFLEANPPRTILNSEHFLRSVTLNAAVILSLFSFKQQELLSTLEVRSSEDFRRAVTQLIAEYELTEVQLMGLDYRHLSFEDFMLVWNRYQHIPEVRMKLLSTAELYHDQRWTDLVMDEYMKGTQNLEPVISRFVNGLP